MGENASALKKRVFLRLAGLLLCLWGSVFLCPSAWPEAADSAQRQAPPQVNIIVSQNIRPYVEAADAMRNALAEQLDTDIEVIGLYRYKGNARQSLADRLGDPDAPGLNISVGPEATAFLWEEIDAGAGRKFYSIVLNPEKISPLVDPDCGISLNIPPRMQLDKIRESLPGMHRVALFHDPEVNADFFAKASQAAFRQGMWLVPAMVASKKEIPETLSAMLPVVDCIWLIPDRTVISESIAQYIIKQSVLKGVPVIGYNQFFYDSGAAVAFVFDYAALGRQTARMVAGAWREGRCSARVPEFKVWLNRSVYEKLDIELPPMEHPLEIGP